MIFSYVIEKGIACQFSRTLQLAERQFLQEHGLGLRHSLEGAQTIPRKTFGEGEMRFIGWLTRRL
jgi:hypothetical protein